LSKILEILDKELQQVPGKVALALEYVSCLPEVSQKNSQKQIPAPGCRETGPYWVDWTEQLGAWIGPGGNDIKILLREDAKEIDADELTLGFTSVLTGVCLNLQGRVAIHANAIVLEAQAVAFVGYSGMGKSTLSAYCASRGAGFMTDDVLVVDEQLRVVPGNPRLKLYPETGRCLGFDASAPTTYKIFYSPEQLGAVLPQQPVPLRQIYLLAESFNSQIYSQPIAATQAVFDLLTHGYEVNQFIPHNPALLDAYVQLVDRVPVQTLFYPREFAALPEVYDFLLEELHSL
jgi:hypothetical protein